MRREIHTIALLIIGLGAQTLCADDYAGEANTANWTTITWSPTAPESGATNNIVLTHLGGSGNDQIIMDNPLNSESNSYETGNFTVNLGTEDGSIKGVAWSFMFNGSPYPAADQTASIDPSDPDYLSFAPLFKVNGNFTLNVYNSSNGNNGKFAIRSHNRVGGLEITGDLISNVVIKEGDSVTSARHVAFGEQYNENGNATSANTNTGFKLWTFKVGGNVELTNTILSIATYHGINAEIAGVVKFNEGYNGNSSTMFVNVDRYDASRFSYDIANEVQTIKVGGLSSYDEVSGSVLKTGLITNNLGSTNVYTGILEITGNGNYEFGGNTSDNKVANEGAKLSIVMSGSGTQILSGQNEHSGDTVVNNGKLLMATINANSKLVVQGGKFGATGDSALTVNNAEWSSGGFVFDLGSENFTLNIGTLSGDFDATLISEFEFANIGNGEFLLISLANENEALAAFDGKTASYDIGGETFDAVFKATGTELSVSFPGVPEPATCAAVFGALALALAAYKRRKS